ncbi:KGG domain-containing protein [Caulobacter sp. DWR1-3-2b1]|uniref:KGG domain-containing protein n=1 Tax=Caulobacter sp. DWR1-3-2b1 TaxID=2804670 RepID=UPI003CEC6F98
MQKTESAPKKARRGFAAMDPEQRRAIAAKGGASVPAEKRSFARSKELASEAGSKGGRARPSSTNA